MFDTGGGSSQFTFGDGDEVEERFSVDVGAVRFTERFGLDGVVSEATLRAAFDAIAADLGRLDGRPPPDALVGIGGAVTNLAAVKHGSPTYDADVVRGTVLDRAEIDRQIELYRTRTADERRQIVGLQPEARRGDPGRRVHRRGPCSTKLGRDSLTVSDRGLRHGLLIDRFGRPAQQIIRTRFSRELGLDGAVDVAVDVVGADPVDHAVSLEHGHDLGLTRASRSVAACGVDQLVDLRRAARRPASR